MRRRFVVWVQLALAWGSGWATPAPASAIVECPSAVHRVPSDDIGDLYENVLTGVDAAAPDDVWAVGYTIGDGGVLFPLAEHWDGMAWTAQLLPSPSAGFNVLLDVAAVGPDDVWAVGEWLEDDFVTSHPLIEHWDGSSWTRVPAPDTRGGALDGVAALSADDVWAVGRTGAEGNLTMHWDGSSWTKVRAPRFGPRSNFLTAVAGSATDDVWAVGFHFKDATSSATSVLHWDGAAWKKVPAPNGDRRSSGLFGVAASAAGKAWAVGDTGNGETGHPLILRFGGGSWKAVRPAAVPGPSAVLRDVAFAGPKDVWAVGSWSDGTRTRTLVQRWDGKRWTRMPSPSPSPDDAELSAVTVDGGTAWMAGTYRRLDINAYRTLVLRACP